MIQITPRHVLITDRDTSVLMDNNGFKMTFTMEELPKIAAALQDYYDNQQNPLAQIRILKEEGSGGTVEM